MKQPGAAGRARLGGRLGFSGYQSSDGSATSAEDPRYRRGIHASDRALALALLLAQRSGLTDHGTEVPGQAGANHRVHPSDYITPDRDLDTVLRSQSASLLLFFELPRS